MRTLLFKPFERYSEKTLLLVGICFTVIGSFLGSIFHSRFDGVLDMHVVSSAPFYQVLIDNLINVFCLVLFLFLAAKYINRKTRLIDILTASMVARIPYYLVAFGNINGIVGKASDDVMLLVNPEMIGEVTTSSLLIVLGFGLLSILFLVWYLVLLFNGFKVASNAKGKQPIILFILSILLAEVLSKVLIHHLN
ncbi:MAG TPA: YIP1 family protein [Flavobacteriaceae bacterium]|nr:YIP1 family protein [Flavobacteriaceae bacterium]